MIYAQQQADPRERDDHARTAITHERQRQPLGGQHAHVHADVDERLRAQPQPEARREVSLELRPAREASCAIQKLRHTSAMNSASVSRDADEAELLGQDREQEIGVRLG